MNTAGVRHRLVDHLEGTALLAERFAAVFGAGEAGRFAGLAHDVGKASCLWQEGLLQAEATGRRVGEDHKTLGVLLSDRRGAARLLGVPLHGHHGGLTSPSEVGTAIRDRSSPRHLRDRAEAEAALGPLLPSLFDGPPVGLPDGFDEPGTDEMFMRFLFSALVDADGLDTAAHRFGGGPRVAASADMAMLWDRFVGRREDLLAGRPAADADRVRGEVYEACLAAAAGPTGIYRLPAPTGSGKTIAAAGFGLRHAAEHGKSRVIVAVPFITITEQNAAVYRRLLDPSGPGEGAPVVLEHHSNIAVDEDGPAQRWRRLAAENWDAPFVVTTTVQLFESLFGRKPGAMRKVHRLANAVIVLDEVQALPAPLLLPIMDGLRTLTEWFGTTVLLASATQPELWALDVLKDITPIEVIADPVSLYKRSARVRYEWWTEPKPTLAQVADRVADPGEAGADRVLTIVNTVANARQMHALLAARAPAGTPVLHLSTAMCAAHRRRVLDEVKERLAGGLPVLLVSTQLIEAGVDLDFPVVFRAMAPADSLQQAAGRANREGHLGPGGGLVVIFDPDDGGHPRSYTLPVGITARYFGPGRADPDDLPSLASYYRMYLGSPRVSGPDSRGAAVQTSRAAFDFRAVVEGPKSGGENSQPVRAKAFRMIDEDTVPIAVPYPGEEQRISDLVEQIRTAPAPEPGLFRDLQPYLVTLQRRTRDRADVASLCRPVFGDLVEWAGTYDKRTGIVLEPSGEEFIA